MFQYFDKNSIRSQESHDIFPYTIGYQEKDFSLSANVNAYCFNKTGSASASYASILTAFYPDQSLSGYIIPTSYYENKVGDQSVSSLLIFSFNSTISRDGISNINESKNVEIICSGYFVDPIAPSYIINPKGTASNQQYIIFDKKDTVTSGTIYISILKNLSVTAVLPGHSDFDYSANDVPIGRIFYDNSLIILDSFTKLNRIYDNTVGNYISIPYPKGVINFYMEDSINGDISYGDFVHNAIAYSTGISESNDTTFDIVIIIDTIKVNFKINKDLNYITVDLPKDKLLFTTNKTKGENSKLYASEDNVNWLTKVGFYDLEGNLLAIGKLSKPIKKTNERDVKLTFKVDS